MRRFVNFLLLGVNGLLLIYFFMITLDQNFHFPTGIIIGTVIILLSMYLFFVSVE